MSYLFHNALRIAGLFILGIFVLPFIYGLITSEPKPKAPEENAVLAVEEAAHKRAQAEDDKKAAADQAQKERRFQFIVLLARSIKDAARDPDSLVWDDITADDDANVVCFEFRAKNGFGGMNREFAVYAKEKMSQSANSWNKSCANKSLNDMNYVKHAL